MKDYRGALRSHCAPQAIRANRRNQKIEQSADDAAIDLDEAFGDEELEETTEEAE